MSPIAARKRLRDEDETSGKEDSQISTTGDKVQFHSLVASISSDGDGSDVGHRGGGDVAITESALGNVMIAQEFMCPCCWEIMFQATTLLPCGHTFCNGCIFHASRIDTPNGDKCPTCRETITDTMPNRFVNNCIEILTSSKSCFAEEDIELYQSRVSRSQRKRRNINFEANECELINDITTKNVAEPCCEVRSNSSTEIKSV